MYREYNDQWRQLDAVKICTENTTASNCLHWPLYSLYIFLQRLIAFIDHCILCAYFYSVWLPSFTIVFSVHILDAVWICTENTMVNEGIYTLEKYVQRIQWSMKAIRRCKNMYREYNAFIDHCILCTYFYSV
jgi:hypothetical protein